MEVSVSVWHAVAPVFHLAGTEGELVSVSVAVEPRSLEELLECLASLAFPVNPEIVHGVPTVVEFPAWESKLYEVRDALRAWGFDPRNMTVNRMVDAIAAHSSAA
jgi:hypothetical protein